MAGLLDILNSDEGRMALGLLSAAGPQATPMSFGQRLQGAMGQQDAYLQAKKQRVMQEQLMAAQIAEHKAKADRMNNLLGQLQAWQNPQGALSGANADTVAQTGNLSPTLANAQVQGNAMQARQQQNPMFGIDPTQISADLAFNEGKGIAGFINERTKPNMSVNNGIVMDLNRTKPGTTLPQISQSGQASQPIADPTAPGGWRIIAPNGAVDTYSAYKKADKAIEAQNTLVEGYDQNSRMPVKVPLSQVLAQQPGASPNKIPPQVQAARDTDRLTILNDELRKATDPGDIAALQREIKRAGGQATATARPMGFQTGPSQTEKNATGLDESMTKKMSDAIEASSARAQSAQSSLSTVGALESALSSGKVMAGPGTSAKLYLTQLGNVAFGSGPDNLSKTREVIQGLAKMTVDARGSLKGQGQISDYEGKLLGRASAGDVETMTVPELNAVISAVKRSSTLQISQHDELMKRANANDWRGFYSEQNTPLSNAPASNLQSQIAQEIARRKNGGR
jgi:hypothetical protein